MGLRQQFQRSSITGCSRARTQRLTRTGTTLLPTALHLNDGLLARIDRLRPALTQMPLGALHLLLLPVDGAVRQVTVIRPVISDVAFADQ